jgi:hypothetical protein
MFDADVPGDLGGELSLVVAVRALELSEQVTLLLVDEQALLDVHPVADVALAALRVALKTTSNE